MDNRSIEATQEYIYALAADPDFSTSGICFAAHTRGVSRSEDGGVSWYSAFDSLALETPLQATSVAVSPCFRSDGLVLAGLPGGIARSIDGGMDWSILAFPAPPPFVSSLAISPDVAHDGMAFAGTMEDGIFLSYDRGEHWEAWNIGLLDHHVLCIAISPAFACDRKVFVGTESGIMCSTNAGHFWREVTFSAEAAPVLSLAISSAFTQDGTIVAGTAEHGLFVSNDGGQHWQTNHMRGDENAINAVLLDPQFPEQPQLLALLDDTPHISRDGGQSWAACIDNGQPISGITAIAAPLGLDLESPLLTGLYAGQVLRYTMRI
jgi:hypothetical protein